MVKLDISVGPEPTLMISKVVVPVCFGCLGTVQHDDLALSQGVDCLCGDYWVTHVPETLACLVGRAGVAKLTDG